jgi:hypothetical protein
VPLGDILEACTEQENDSQHMVDGVHPFGNCQAILAVEYSILSILSNG